MAPTIETFIDKNESWKRRVSVNLDQVQSEGNIDGIAEVMRDPTDMDEVREHAGASLGRIGSDYALDILEHNVKYNPDHKTRLFALVGLRASASSRSTEILLDLLKDDAVDGELRRSACYSLANRHVADVISYAIQYIDAPFMSENTFLDSNLAVESLLQFKTSEAIDAIVDWAMLALRDASRPRAQREHAANYLMRFGDERCVDLMIQMIDDDAVKAESLHAGDSGNHAVETLKKIATPPALAAVQAWEERQQTSSS